MKATPVACALFPALLLARRRAQAFSALVLGALLLALSGCGKPERRTISDRAGETATVPAHIERIVSTAPSNTEIIVDLGLADKLVAVDRYSRGIPGVRHDLPQVDFFYPDGEALISLRPDLIIVNGHNRTGAGGDPFALLREAGIAVANVPFSRSISAIYEDIAFIAELLGVPERGAELVRRMKEQVDEVRATSAAIAERRTVCFEISPAPDITTFGQGTFLNDMLEAAGAINLFGDQSGIIFPGAELLVERNPDVIVTNVSAIPDPVAEIKRRPGFDTISAVKNGRVYQVDTDSSSRPSHRIILALRQIARAVYPEQYAADPEWNAAR